MSKIVRIQFCFLSHQRDFESNLAVFVVVANPKKYAGSLPSPPSTQFFVNRTLLNPQVLKHNVRQILERSSEIRYAVQIPEKVKRIKFFYNILYNCANIEKQTYWDHIGQYIYSLNV